MMMRERPCLLSALVSRGHRAKRAEGLQTMKFVRSNLVQTFAVPTSNLSRGMTVVLAVCLNALCSITIAQPITPLGSTTVRVQPILPSAIAPASPTTPSFDTKKLPPASHIGVVNCTNSLCHGAVKTWKESNVLQNEYITWSRVDRHARSYRTLFSDTSKRIVNKLDLPTNAHETKLCLDCHTHNPEPDKRGERIQISDGIQCEACHGAASNWVESHAQPGVTHQQNVAAGLTPLSNPVQRATLCLSCHMGNSDKYVNHRLMAAGHPRLSFELETFVKLEPPHYQIDADYLQRKQPWNTVKSWAIAQAVAVQTQMGILADPVRGRDGLFPELTLFDCHACHHPMSDRRWQATTSAIAVPGRVRVNDANLIMLRQIARQISPALGAEAAAQITSLHAAIGGVGGDAIAEAKKTQALASRVALAVAAAKVDDNLLRAVIGGIIDDGLSRRYIDYAGAEQATMAISSLVSYLYQSGKTPSARSINAGLSGLQAAVSNDERYKPEAFQLALANFKATLK